MHRYLKKFCHDAVKQKLRGETPHNLLMHIGQILRKKH